MATNKEGRDEANIDLLGPSELGTKDYWDAAYSRELLNHEEDSDDEGTIWFSESNAEVVVCKELDKLEEQGLLSRRGRRDEDDSSPLTASRFLDLGTGNGHMLVTLRGEDDRDGDDDSWYGEMVGVDYSLASVQLARRVVSQRVEESGSTTLPRIELWDILADSPDPDWLNDGFDVVLDKGTFDAISLMESTETTHPCEKYRSKVIQLIKPGGFLFITSCNWTRDEIVHWLASSTSDGLTFYDEAKYPTFTFGGKKGQTVVTVIFRRDQIESSR